MAGRVIKSQRGGGVETLPPPGDERREVLAARTDALEQEAEERADALELAPVDPKKLRPEREILQHINELEVSSADPSLAYCWVQTGYYGRFIKMKVAQGWEVVQGDRPEAIELKGVGADTTRRLGDVILMSIHLDRYIRLRRQEEARRQAQERAITSNLEELGAKAGITVHTDVPLDTLRRMEARNRASAIADRQADRLIREGRMPGVGIRAS